MKSVRFKLPVDSAYYQTLFIFTFGLLIVCSLYNPFISKQNEVIPSVLGRSYPLQQPDIHANDGETIHLEGATVIVESGTFSKDVYVRVDRTARGNPIEVRGLWQISDIWNVRLRFHANDDEVSVVETQKKYILSFPYTTDFLITDQGVRFDEQSLTLIKGETVTGPWTVLENSVVDTNNNTVSVLTQAGGYFMIAGGFYQRTENIAGNSEGQNSRGLKVIEKKEDEEDSDKEDRKAIVEKDSEPIEKNKAKNDKKNTTNVEKPRSVGEAAARLSVAIGDFFSVLFGR